MKKTMLLVAMALISAGCFAQKANVKKAKSYIQSETPDYNAARQAIEEAIVNPETSELADTWYQAGMIGYIQNEKINFDASIGQTVDEDLKGQAITESYDYFIKADELASAIVVDKKGREVMKDAKTRKLIISKMETYYANEDFIKYSGYLSDQKDFAKAYEVLMRHLKIVDLPMMQDEKIQARMPKDTTYEQYRYYAAYFAIQAEMHKEAIAILEEMKNGEYEATVINQFLYQEYVALNDTVNFVRVLKDAVTRFPQEPWFLQNLINYYIFSGQTDQAIVYLTEAIEREPNVGQYRLIKGNILANENRYEEAAVEYEKALEVEPTLADAKAGQGRIFYNQAVKMNEDAAYIADAKEYKKALEDMNDMFLKSLPYFEEALKMEPDNRDYMIILRTLYYRFEMEAEYEAISAELNK